MSSFFFIEANLRKICDFYARHIRKKAFFRRNIVIFNAKCQSLVLKAADRHDIDSAFYQTRIATIVTYFVNPHLSNH